MLLQIVDTFFTIYMVMLFIRILSSWFPEYRDHQVVRFISFYTDPYLNFFRRFIPPLGMIDLSPIIAFFCLSILNEIAEALVRLIVK